ncbi:MAG: C25 family cysteine peptidase [Candidatus Micrarchaeota archaeon]
MKPVWLFLLALLPLFHAATPPYSTSVVFDQFFVYPGGQSASDAANGKAFSAGDTIGFQIYLTALPSGYSLSVSLEPKSGGTPITVATKTYGEADDKVWPEKAYDTSRRSTFQYAVPEGLKAGDYRVLAEVADAEGKPALQQDGRPVSRYWGPRGSLYSFSIRNAAGIAGPKSSPALLQINVDSAYHASPGDYSDAANGKTFTQADALYLRFRLQGAYRGDRLQVYASRDSGMKPIPGCSYSFADDNDAAFNLRLRCPLSSVAPGTYSVYAALGDSFGLPVEDSSGAPAAIYWGPVGEPYTLIVHAAPPQTPSPSPSPSPTPPSGLLAEDNSWGSSFSLAFEVAYPDKTSVEQSQTKTSLQETKASSFISDAISFIKVGVASIAEWFKSLFAKVTRVRLSIFNKKGEKICESEVAASKEGLAGSTADNCADGAVVSCVAPGKDTGIEATFCGTDKDSVLVKLKEVPRTAGTDKALPEKSSKAKADAKIVEYDAKGLQAFSSEKTTGSFTVRVKGDAAALQYKPVGSFEKCLQIGTPKKTKGSFLGIKGSVFEVPVEYLPEKCLAACGTKESIEASVPGMQQENVRLEATIDCFADVLIVSTSKLKTDAAFDTALARYRKALRDEGISSQYVVLDDAKAAESFGSSLATSSLRNTEAVKQSIEKIRAAVNPKYLLILGGDDVVPMPSTRFGATKKYNKLEDFFDVIYSDSLYASSQYSLPKFSASTFTTGPTSFAPDIVVARMPAGKGDMTSSLVTVQLETAAEVHEKGLDKKKRSPLVVGDICGDMDLPADDCFTRFDADAFSKAFSGKDCASASGTCHLAPDYCLKAQQSGVSCSQRQSFESRLQTGDLLAVFSHGGGGTNWHAFDKNLRFYTILTAEDAKRISLTNHPIVINDGCVSASIKEVGEGGDWAGWAGKPATEDKMVALVLLRKGASNFLGGTTNMWGKTSFQPFIGGELVNGGRFGDIFLKVKRKLIGVDGDSSSVKGVNDIHTGLTLQLYGDPTIEINNG